MWGVAGGVCGVGCGQVARTLVGPLSTYARTPAVVEAATFLLLSLTRCVSGSQAQRAVDAVVDEGALDAVLSAVPLDAWCNLTTEERGCGARKMAQRVRAVKLVA